MLDVNDKKFNNYGMPVHDPIRDFNQFYFKSDVVNITYTIKKPEMIASIVPEPLSYEDNKICLGLILVKELKGNFSKYAKLWKEIAVRIPVIFNGKPKTYICSVYTNDIKTIIVDREVLGIPKIPSMLSVEHNGYNFKAKLVDYESKRDMINFAFKPDFALKGHPPGGKFQKPPGIVLFKHIPSATLRNEAEVKQLVELKYSKASIDKIIMGEGNIELLEGAPDYLKEAGIEEVNESVYHDIELKVAGGKVIHNYIQKDTVWSKLCKKMR